MNYFRGRLVRADELNVGDLVVMYKNNSTGLEWESMGIFVGIDSSNTLFLEEGCLVKYFIDGRSSYYVVDA